MPDRVSRCVLLLTLVMFLLILETNSMSVVDLEVIDSQTKIVFSEPLKQGMLAGTPHDPIAINGDANFSDTALVEGWPGDGSPENPYIIDGLDIDLGGGNSHCISIRYTRVNFIISNCSLRGASGEEFGVGINLENVTNGELDNNICNNNLNGIFLYFSNSNTVINNTCSNNTECGIYLEGSNSNIVVKNTCNNNNHGIFLYWSSFNNVTENLCNSNGESGINLFLSNSNTVINNTCSNNRIGIHLHASSRDSAFNCTVSNNTCSNNSIGISLEENSDSNTVVNNTCNSDDHGINIAYSRSNIITNNTLTGCGFFFTGTLAHCRQIEVTGNSVNSLPLVFLQDQVGNVVSSPAGQVILVGCSQIIVKDQTLMDCSVGVLLCHTNLTTIVNNTCNNNDIGIYLDYSHRNTVSYNTCNYNRIGIYLYLSNNNTVSHNTCLSNTEHDIYLDESDSNTLANNITTISEEFVYVVLLLVGFVGIALLSSGWRKVSARGGLDNIIVPVQKARRHLEARRQQLARGSPDDIIVPTRYRLASWLRKRRALKHEDVDETLEPDSSDQ